MNWPFAVGRVLLVVYFVVSGVQKLIDIPDTGRRFGEVGAKIPFPAAVTDAAQQVADAVSMSLPQLLAIAAGVIEIAAALLIAFNVMTRTMAVVLLLFTAVVTFYFHDFWNMEVAERANAMHHALKNLSIMGALLMLASWPRRLVMAEAPPGDRLEPL
jgi:uncharacterized membrane protein YphA (DoxX/SURF4 family)